MLKFIERQKVERQLRRIDGKTDAETVRKREHLPQDLRYISQYPKDCKYVALFPSGGHTEESKKQVDEMRLRIHGKGAPDEAAGSSDVGSLEKTEGGNERAETVADEPEGDFFLADD